MDEKREQQNKEREAALEAWQRGELGVGDDVVPRPVPAGPDESFDAPPKRAAFPPSFFFVAAAALSVLALEPSADLGYFLTGPSDLIDLGRPADYHLDRAVDGAPVHVEGLATPRRGSFSRWGTDYQVLSLATVPVLVRRAPEPVPPSNVAEYYKGDGRLVKLEEHRAGFFERLVRPSARYTGIRQTFAALGDIPAGGTAWLLLEGDLPRRSFTGIAVPIALWALVGLFVFLGLRSLRRRRALAEWRRRSLRTRS